MKGVLIGLGLGVGLAGGTVGVLWGIRQQVVSEVTQQVQDLQPVVEVAPQSVPSPSPQSPFAATASPVAVTVAQRPARQSVTPVKFENLSPCDQLDAIAKGGKSVAEYIVGSGYENYESQVKANCNWHNEQLAIAWSILNPPVVEVPVTTVYREEVIHSQPSQPASQPVHSSRNNCNGIREPGESYSASCQEAQQFNDSTWGARDARDNRTWNRGGFDNRGGTAGRNTGGSANGYSTK